VKISKQRLRQIISEELQRINEGFEKTGDETVDAAAETVLRSMDPQQVVTLKTYFMKLFQKTGGNQ
tara:strand:+ start:80 stop:277 length:198 start_codon:yes stop_codon:yes gene_type:complete